MSHTPGPWRPVKNPFRNEGWFVLAGEGAEGASVSAMIASQSISQGQFKTEADARLIAAAPELLAALKEVIANHCGNDKLFCGSCTDARRMIAKAEGRDAS